MYSVISNFSNFKSQSNFKPNHPINDYLGLRFGHLTNSLSKNT